MSIHPTEFNTHSTGDVLFEKKYLSGTFPSLDSILLQFLKDANAAVSNKEISTFTTPQICVVCVAGPCTKEIDAKNNTPYTTSNVTALGWKLDSRVLAKALSIPAENVTIMNDFEGVGYGVLGLPPAQLVTLNKGTVVPQAPIAVLGPGTGLGAAYLVYHNGNYHVCASEGGHVAYTPSTPQDFALLNYIRAELGSPTAHVSAERVASGTGLRSVYRFVRHTADPANPLYKPENVGVYRNPPTLEQCAVLGHQFPARAICDMAQAGDKYCVETLHIFATALGRTAGNLLVSTLPLGGFFIAGGMGAKVSVIQENLTNQYFPTSFLSFCFAVVTLCRWASC